MAQGSQPDSSTKSCAEALAAHYLPMMIAFTHGHQATFRDQEDAVASVLMHLSRFEKAGLGINIRLQGSRIETVSPASALCWVTWRIEPKNEIAPWEWANVYGFRVGQDGKQGWEFVISDNEIMGLLQHVPDLFKE